MDEEGVSDIPGDDNVGDDNVGDEWVVGLILSFH